MSNHKISRSVFDIELTKSAIGDDGSINVDDCELAVIGHKFGDDVKYFYPEQVTDFISLIEDDRKRNITTFSWNGAMFDFYVLHEKVDDPEVKGRIARLCMSHYDGMLMFCSHFGFPVGLDAVCRGFGVSGKLKSVKTNDGKTVDFDGSMFPEFWSKGEKDACLSYLEKDLASTDRVCQLIEESRTVRFIAKSGRHNTYRLTGFDNVLSCLSSTHVFPSWVSRPFDFRTRMDWVYDNY